MAITSVEILASKQVEFSDGSLSGTRRFLVYDAADGTADPIASPLRPSAAVIATGVVLGDQYDTSGTVETTLLATGYTVEAADVRRYTWHVTWRYGSGSPGQPPSAEAVASVSFSVQFIDCWRVLKGQAPITGTVAELVVPADGKAGFNSNSGSYIASQDCAGVPVDSSGEPVNCPVRMGELRIQQYVASFTNATWEAINSRVGKRNIGPTAYYGAAPGKLLYTGANSQIYSNGSATIEHSFAYDNMYHLRQNCAKQHGEGGWQKGSEYKKGGVVPDAYKDRGFPVIFIQPFPELIDFTTLV